MNDNSFSSDIPWYHFNVVALVSLNKIKENIFL